MYFQSLDSSSIRTINNDVLIKEVFEDKCKENLKLNDTFISDGFSIHYIILSQCLNVLQIDNELFPLLLQQMN